jgi:hypothetical protein
MSPGGTGVAVDAVAVAVEQIQATPQSVKLSTHNQPGSRTHLGLGLGGWSIRSLSAFAFALARCLIRHLLRQLPSLLLSLSLSPFSFRHDGTTATAGGWWLVAGVPAENPDEWGRMGLAWGRMGLAWGRMGLAWGWHGVGMGLACMGLAWGWHGVGMGLAWGWHAWGWHGVYQLIEAY